MAMQSINDSIRYIEECLLDPTTDISGKEIVKRFNFFENDSTILFKHLSTWISIINEHLLKFMEANSPHDIVDNETVEYHMDAFYQICKICAWKNVFKYCFTKVSDLNLILDYLSFTNSANWKLAQFYLSWIYVILLSPFNFNESNEEILRVTEPWRNNQVLFSIVANIWAKMYQMDPNLLSNHLSSNKLSYVDDNDIVIWNFLMKFHKNTHFKAFLQEETHLEMIHELTENLLSKNEVTSTILKLFPKLVILHRRLNNWEIIEEIIDWYLQHLNIEFIDLRFDLAHSMRKIAINLNDDELCKEIVQSIINDTIDLIEHNSMEFININLLHTHLLIIAEQNKFITTHMTENMSLIIEKILTFANNFQQLHLNHVIKGSMIKDANNFIIWSWSKEKKLPFNIVAQIFPQLLVNSLFDRDFLIRKSSQAALQELLGRHGSQILSNVTIMKIIELPIHNLKESYADNMIQLYNIFKRESLSEFFNKIVDWMIFFNLAQNFDSNIARLSIGSIRNFIAASKEFQFEKLVEKLCVQYKNNTDSDISGRLLMLLVELNNFLENSEKYSIVMERLYLIIRNDKRAKYNLHTKGSFNFLSVMSYYKYRMNNDMNLNLNSEDIDFYYKIMTNINESNIWFEEFNNINCELVEYVANNKTKCFASDSDFQKFWLQYDKHITFNKALICSSMPKLPIGLFFEYYDLHNNMSCLSKSLVIKTMIKSGHSFNALCNTTEFFGLITEFLTDYTITEQGDVGRLVRVEACQLIYHKFESIPPKTIQKISLLILKLAAESANIVREIAYKIIVDKFNANTSLNSSHNVVLFEYQKHLNDRGVSKEFWRSYSTYAGAQKYIEDDLKIAISDFLTWYDRCEKDVQKQVLNDIIIGIPTLNEICTDPKQVKYVITGLIFLMRIWSSRAVSAYVGFNWNGAYAKLHNLTLFQGKGNKMIKENVIKLLPFLTIAWKTSGEASSNNYEFINCMIDKLVKYILGQPEQSILRKVSLESLLQIFLEFDTVRQLDYLLYIDAHDNYSKIQKHKLHL